MSAIPYRIQWFFNIYRGYERITLLALLKIKQTDYIYLYVRKSDRSIEQIVYILSSRNAIVCLYYNVSILARNLHD